MNTLIRILALVIAVAWLGGCASVPADSGFLSDYARLERGQYLERYWADAGIAQSGPAVIRLTGISIDRITDKEGVTAADCATWLRAALEEGGIVSGPTGNAPAHLELAITFMDPGSAAKRIWAGELGAGHAQVQVEGKVIDTESGVLLAAFAERRSSSGAIGLKDIGGDAGPGLVEQMLRDIGGDVTNELQSSFAAK